MNHDHRSTDGIPSYTDAPEKKKNGLQMQSTIHGIVLDLIPKR